MYNGKNANFWKDEKSFSDIYEDLCTRSQFLVIVLWEMKVITFFSTFRKIQNEISSLTQKFSTFSILDGKIENFLPYFQPKIEKIENFCVKLEISFW